MNHKALNVMIVDDSLTYRSILSQVLKDIPEVHLQGTASNGKIALNKLAAEKADLVLLDIEMPEMDGLETLKVIKRQYPNIGVVMVSGMNRSSADITIRALESGALDFISKPDGDSALQNTQELQRKLVPVVRHFLTKHQMGMRPQTIQPRAFGSSSATALPPSTLKKPVSLPHKIDVLAVGVSTGGPNALAELIPALPGNLGVPVLLVQHMPPVFTASLASSLDKKSALHVKEAEHGETVLPNTVYIAPGGRHMTVQKDDQQRTHICLNDDPPVNSCRPAVDVLFNSIAQTYGKNILSVMLTGMGNDGALGVKRIKQGNSCYSLSQSEKSCVVYGMPRAVEEMGLADEVLDLNQMAHRITELVKKTV